MEEAYYTDNQCERHWSRHLLSLIFQAEIRDLRFKTLRERFRARWFQKIRDMWLAATALPLLPGLLLYPRQQCKPGPMKCEAKGPQAAVLQGQGHQEGASVPLH